MTYDDALQITIHDVVHTLAKHLKREDSSSTIVSMMVFPWNNFHQLSYPLLADVQRFKLYIPVVYIILLIQHPNILCQFESVEDRTHGGERTNKCVVIYLN